MEEEIQQALKILQKGGTILYPTDTIWGIGCDALNKQAVQKVFSIKRRPEERSVILLVADSGMLQQYVQADERVIKLFEDRPTSMIFSDPKLPAHLVQEDGTVAIRIVQDTFCRGLIMVLGHPLVSTSANISGEPAPLKFSEISPSILHEVDYVVNWRQDEENEATASRIIRLSFNNEIEILRD